MREGLPKLKDFPAAIGGSSIRRSVQRQAGSRLRPQTVESLFLFGSMDSWFFLFFPRWLILLVAGPEETKNRAGMEVLRLIQIRVATPSLRNRARVSRKNIGSCPTKGVGMVLHSGPRPHKGRFEFDKTPSA